MSTLEISKIENQVGERCWRVRLLDVDGLETLRSVTGLAKGVALSVAKTLKFKGADAPFVEKRPNDPTLSAWLASDKCNAKLCIELTVVADTCFALDGKAGDKEEDIKLVIESVLQNLQKAEITWNPSDADPANEDKECDQTETLGIAGSSQ